jgi:hypothetical protein
VSFSVSLKGIYGIKDTYVVCKYVKKTVLETVLYGFYMGIGFGHLPKGGQQRAQIGQPQVHTAALEQPFLKSLFGLHQSYTRYMGIWVCGVGLIRR